MLVPGSVDSHGNWAEASSLGRSIDDALTAAGVIDPSTDTATTAQTRRKTLAALANGLIQYFKANLEIDLAAGALRNTGESGGQLPLAAKSFSITSGAISIPAGGILGASETAIQVPLVAKKITGAIS